MNRDTLCAQVVDALAQLDQAQRRYSVQAATYVSSCWGEDTSGSIETATPAEVLSQLRTMRAQVEEHAEHFERTFELLRGAGAAEVA